MLLRCGSSSAPDCRTMKTFSLENIPRLTQPRATSLGRAFWQTVCIFGFSVVLPSYLAASAAKYADPSDPREPASNAGTIPVTSSHVSADRNGALTTNDGLTLRLSTDLGSVHITPIENGAAPVVRYLVHIETDAKEPAAKRLLDAYVLKAKSTPAGVEIIGTLPPQPAHEPGSGVQFWVHFEVSVPRGYHVEVKTGAGDVEAEEIGGSAYLATQGGNILTGKIGARETRGKTGGQPEARLETEGGHIQVQEVSGDLTAFTAGGHIIAGRVTGDASLRSGGGHIRAGQIDGRADLETDGGNIAVKKAGGFVNVRTGGGQIDFGEVRGSVHAQTGGGGIRVIYVSGPMEVVSNGGSICLTKVAGAVQAATSEGTITAWINPDPAVAGSAVKLSGASQLASGNGDIAVFLPRNLAATIEAVVTSGGVSHIEADPAMHLSVQPAPSTGSDSVRALATLNGGGAPLRLRTASGIIHLQFLDSQTALRDSLIREQQARLNQNFNNVAPIAFGTSFGNNFPNDLPAGTPPAVPALPDASAPENKSDWFDSWMKSLEHALTGSLREDPTEFQKRLSYAPHPSYPALAQSSGIQGTVKLQVRVTIDGRLEVVKLLEGEPILADAATGAVKQWRARPASINGKPVEVISTVTFKFQL
jgi:TonB family protein